MERDSLFYGVKFGDRFLTRKGEMVVYLGSGYQSRIFITEKRGKFETHENGHCTLNGDSNDDIVSKYIESVNQETPCGKLKKE